jgi:predicted DNA-binding protein with PD1-like motif
MAALIWESTRSRHLVGRLERGDAVHESLVQIAHDRDVRAASVIGLGAFEYAELVEYDQQRKVYKESKHFECAMEVLSLIGNVSLRDGAPFVHLHAALSRETDNGIEVIGGHLVQARVFALELALDVFMDIKLERGIDPATGLGLWAQCPAAPRVMQSAEPAATLSQASHAAQVSPASLTEALMPFAREPLVKKAKPREELVDEPQPKRGDWLEHKQFGLCRVEGEDLEGGLMIRLPSGARKVISLEYLQVLPGRREGDGYVYSLVPRPRR